MLYGWTMQRLECPIDGCSATIEAETERAVMDQAEEHANDSHPELELDDETVETIRSSIIEV